MKKVTNIKSKQTITDPREFLKECLTLIDDIEEGSKTVVGVTVVFKAEGGNIAKGSVQTPVFSTEKDSAHAFYHLHCGADGLKTSDIPTNFSRS